MSDPSPTNATPRADDGGGMSARNLFDPKTGVFRENIRLPGLDGTSELRESMQRFGWIKHFPALVDENGVVLVGHRRLKVAEALGIDPVTVTVTLGSGEEADAERVKLAIASNIGGKPLSKEDRKHIADHLYCKHGWSMECIAEALKVTKGTISKDLAGIVSDGNNQTKHAKTVTNPKGSGRRKGSTKKAAAGKTSEQPAAKPVVAPILASEDDDGEPLVPDRATVKARIQRANYIDAVDITDKMDKETRAKFFAHLKEKFGVTEIDPASLSKTAQEKLEAATRRRMWELDASFHSKVAGEVKKRINEIVLPHWKQQIAMAKKLYGHRRGAMSKDTFNTIRRALHPDSRNSISDQKLSEAFDTFMGLEKYLLDEKDSPTAFPDLPASWDEWEAAKRKETELRKKQRAEPTEATAQPVTKA
jgi:ParB-like chromosome segregation protein Spo0J